MQLLGLISTIKATDSGRWCRFSMFYNKLMVVHMITGDNSGALYRASRRHSSGGAQETKGLRVRPTAEGDHFAGRAERHVSMARTLRSQRQVQEDPLD